MHVDLNLLRILVMVMDERNVTRAAERLHQSQPSVSIALRRLREQFGDPLFLPLRRGVVPTPRAIDLAQRAAKILRDVEDMTQAEQFDPASEGATVSIAANDYGLLSVVGGLTERLRQSAPGIRLHVRRLGPDISRQLDRQEVDMAVTMLSEPARSAYVRPLFRDSFELAVAKDHALAGKTPTLDEFCAYDHLRIAWADNSLIDPVDNVLQDLARTRNVALVVPNYLCLPQILEGSDLVAVAPRGLIPRFCGVLDGLPLPFPVPGFAVNLVWDDRTHTSALHGWVREQIFALARGDDAEADMPPEDVDA